MRKRKCEILAETEELRKDLGIRSSYDIEIWIDSENEDAILKCIEDHFGHFRRILHEVLNGRVHEDLYEKLDDIAEDTSEMKFKGTPNPRIYCKEFKNDGKKIVMIIAHENKASQKIDKKIKAKLKAISKYDYEFKKE